MTPLQHRCLVMITTHIREKGYSPSLRELSSGLDRALSNTAAVVNALVDQGQLVRTSERQRNLRLPGLDLSRVPAEALRAELERRGV